VQALQLLHCLLRPLAGGDPIDTVKSHTWGCSGHPAKAGIEQFTIFCGQAAARQNGCRQAARQVAGDGDLAIEPCVIGSIDNLHGNRRAYENLMRGTFDLVQLPGVRTKRHLSNRVGHCSGLLHVDHDG